MGDTITSVSLGRGPSAGDPAQAQPVLFKLVECDHPFAGTVRHRLDATDAVVVGRGARGWRRDGGELAVRVPDGRMSGEHVRLTRGPSGWTLDDLGSKNGCVLNGTLTRRALLSDGDVVELGHTFFLYREAPVPADAAPDMTVADLPAPTPALATMVASLERGYASLARIATTPVAVVLLGETGTGKEVVARALHQLSGRPGPFVAVNCGALPDSLVESELFGHRKGAFSGAVTDRAGFIRSADRGTLFLDEVGELPPDSQVAFLRVLQEQEVVPVGDDRPVKVDARLCAATLRDLDDLVEQQLFRRDLYARLFGLVLELPPLRDRKEDLGILVAALLARQSGGDRAIFTPAALRALVRHDWPLNIRELEKALIAALALAAGQAIELEHLPPAVRRPRAPRASTPVGGVGPLTAEEIALRERLIALLTEHGGNVASVARVLSKGRMQIHRWARRFGLDIGAFRR